LCYEEKQTTYSIWGTILSAISLSSLLLFKALPSPSKLANRALGFVWEFEGEGGLWG